MTLPCFIHDSKRGRPNKSAFRLQIIKLFNIGKEKRAIFFREASLTHTVPNIDDRIPRRTNLKIITLAGPLQFLIKPIKNSHEECRHQISHRGRTFKGSFTVPAARFGFQSKGIHSPRNRAHFPQHNLEFRR